MRPSQIIAQAVAAGELAKEDTHEHASSEDVVVELPNEIIEEGGAIEEAQQQSDEKNDPESDDSKEVRNEGGVCYFV